MKSNCLIPKYIRKNKEHRIAKMILKMTDVRRLTLPVSRLNRKIVTKMSSSNIGQWNKIKSPEKETHTHMET